MNKRLSAGITRREFVELTGLAGAVWGMSGNPAAGAAEPNRAPTDAGGNVIPGVENKRADPNPTTGWQPFSDQKIRVGIAGYGLCQFGAAFGFQNHPNVDVVAVTDLIPARCADLAKACRCEKTYPSCEEMIKDDKIGVTGGSFTEVSCLGMPSIVSHLRPENNAYSNPCGSEIALFRTSEGGMSRMAVSWDIAVAGGERGRVYGQTYEEGAVDTGRPPLPPGMDGAADTGEHTATL